MVKSSATERRVGNFQQDGTSGRARVGAARNQTRTGSADVHVDRQNYQEEPTRSNVLGTRPPAEKPIGDAIVGDDLNQRALTRMNRVERAAQSPVNKDMYDVEWRQSQYFQLETCTEGAPLASWER